jgi:diphthamide biosynthesis protein 3
MSATKNSAPQILTQQLRLLMRIIQIDCDTFLSPCTAHFILPPPKAHPSWQRTYMMRSRSKYTIPSPPRASEHCADRFQDMTYDSTLQIYHYPCPCGDRFEINIEDLRDGEEIAVCPSCSLQIRVIFDKDDLPKPDGGNQAQPQQIVAAAV